MGAGLLAPQLTMPIDNKTRTTSSKPITPALSSNFRPRTAVTPRLAGSAPTSPAIGLTRSLRTQTISPEREEANAASLYGNITPRTGARNSRISDDSPATPVTSRALKVAQNKSSPQLGALSATHTQQNSSTSASNATKSSGGSSNSQPRNTAKFFHADEVQASTTDSPRRFGGLKSPQTPRTETASPRASPKKPPATNNDGKFFRADDAARPTRPTLAAKASSTSNVPPASPSSLSSKTNRNAAPSSPSQHSPGSKLGQPTSPIWGKVRSSSNSSQRPLVTNPTQMYSIAERRRSSSLQSISTTSKEHRKSLSTSTLVIPSFATPTAVDINPVQSKILQLIRPLMEPPPVSPSGALTASDTVSPRSTSMNSADTVRTSVTSDTDRSDFSKIEPTRPPLKHMRTGSEASHQMSSVSQAQLEAAANARRERKVLDLEISNSSLLAINKTLERELRKQNAELRRFRRLSRSGRISIAPSTRSISGQSLSTMNTLEEMDDEDEDLGSDGDDSHDESVDEEDEILSEGQSSLLSSMDRARRRAKDEKRLMLDLSKHQQILIDSQKLSQSIQRCLNCTDELIKDATKALAYHVGIGDVKLGGRVLSHDEDEEQTSLNDPAAERSNSIQGLLSPSITKAELAEAGLLLSSHDGLNEFLGTKENDAVLSTDRTQFSNKPTFVDSPSPMESPILLPDRHRDLMV